MQFPHCQSKRSFLFYNVQDIGSVVNRIQGTNELLTLSMTRRSLGHKTLVAWWIGINDVSDAARNTTITDWPAFWEAEMNSLFGAVVRDFMVMAHAFSVLFVSSCN